MKVFMTTMQRDLLIHFYSKIRRESSQWKENGDRKNPAFSSYKKTLNDFVLQVWTIMVENVGYILLH